MLRLIIRIILILIAFLAIWYLASRITSSGNAVNSYTVRPLYSEKAPAKQDYLSVAAFNIAHGRGAGTNASNWHGGDITSAKEHLDELAKFLKDLELDIVVLNEVDFSTVWSNHINQAKYIAERAGFTHVVEQRNIDIGMPFMNYKFGNAILSKHPVLESEFVPLEPFSTWENLMAGNHDAVSSIIETPFGQVGVLAVHLESRSEAHRLASAKIIRRYSETINHPVLALGDFNSAPADHSNTTTNEEGHNAISYLLNDTIFESDRRIKDTEKYYTYPGDDPDRVIDWILVNKDYDVTNIKMLDSQLSDHRLVSARLFK